MAELAIRTRHKTNYGQPSASNSEFPNNYVKDNCSPRKTCLWPSHRLSQPDDIFGSWTQECVRAVRTKGNVISPWSSCVLAIGAFLRFFAFVSSACIPTNSLMSTGECLIRLVLNATCHLCVLSSPRLWTQNHRGRPRVKWWHNIQMTTSFS